MANTTNMQVSIDRAGVKAMERLARAIEHSNQIRIDIERNRKSYEAELSTTDLPRELGCVTNGDVISYKGENYYRACNQFVTDLPDGGQSFCILPTIHRHATHMDTNDNMRGI